MTTKHKESLNFISNTLNKAGLHWCLGGSALLYFNSIDVPVNDIDICLSCSQSELESLFPNIDFKDTSENLTSGFLLKAQIDGVEFDFIGNFKIKLDQDLISIPLIKDRALNEINLGCLETWFCAYSLLSRDKKVELILKHFKSTPPKSEIIDLLKESNIPTKLISSLEALY